MANLSIIGRHALLFDDDAGANFVNSAAALVPWGADPSLLIDRHDVRHLLDRVPLRPKPGYIYKSEEEVAEELVVDRERFLDLPSEDKSGPNETEETSNSQGAYAAVSFSYGSTEEDSKPGSELKLEGSSSCYRPPFPLPDSLLNNLPPSEKVHQIIARTAKFVSEHGGQSEIVLRVKQGSNPTFGFLLPDHHLHPYFRFLVENSNLLKTEAISDKGALSLLGSIYGSAEDEDDAITPLSNTNPTSKGMEIENKVPKQEKETPLLTVEKPALAKKNPSIAKINPSIAKVKVKEGTENVGTAKPQMVMMEPSSVMKIAMEKIAEFIQRNGRELEAVLINQDRSTNNFPFLVPTNAYHPYYLKILEEAKEGKKSTEKRTCEPTPSSETASREPSEEPRVPKKFKMAIGKMKKPEKTEATNQNLRGGLTTQEAAAIVRAATRGVSPSFRPEVSKSDLGQGKSVSGPNKPSGIDEDWIAKTIAKTAALVSSEAASVSKEEKIKAERLKRAKMFASMIKSGGASGDGPPLPQLLNKVESSKVEDAKGSRTNNEVDDGETSRREKKLEKGGSEREKRHHEKNYRKHGDFLEREQSERKREKYSDEESCEDNPGHDTKHHKHRHHGDHRKRNHSSSDEEKYSDEETCEESPSHDNKHHKHRHHGDPLKRNRSSSDEERERTERKRERRSYNDKEGHGRKRERSCHRKSYSLSDSEEEDRRYRQSHRDERRRSYSKRWKDEKDESLSNAGEQREDSADVPVELRAKIRAMLMETL